MKQTPNYNLPILEAGDKYLKDYQNDAFSVIDTELKAMNDKINTLDNVEGSILETSQGFKNTNAEIIDARVGQTTLGDKIRNIDTQLEHNIHEIKNNYSTKKELEVERSRINLLSKIENGTTEGNTELLDIRIDSDGIEHESAGDSVRSQFININNKIGEFDYSLIPQDVTTNQTNGAVRE